MAGGRQRTFDETDALEKAMNVFWKNGYIGASLADLTAGMGINKPSMYAAFGNKEQLFILATQHYIENYAQPLAQHLHTDKPLRERLRDYLSQAIAGQCNASGPKGCYIALCVSESAGDTLPEKAMASVIEARDFSENYLIGFLVGEMEKGHLDSSADCRSLARYLITLLHGTASMARGGKSFEELSVVIDTVLSSLPWSNSP